MINESGQEDFGPMTKAEAKAWGKECAKMGDFFKRSEAAKLGWRGRRTRHHPDCEEDGSCADQCRWLPTPPPPAREK